jgi:hypothetical protein
LPFRPCQVDPEHCNFFVSVNLEFLSFAIFNLCALYTSSMYGLHILKVEFSLWFSFALQGFSLPNLYLFFCVLFSIYNLQMQFFHDSQSFNHNG